MWPSTTSGAPEAIAKLTYASELLAQKPEARYDYSPLIQTLVTLGLRIGEALALRKADVDLLAGKAARPALGGQERRRAGRHEDKLAVDATRFG